MCVWTQRLPSSVAVTPASHSTVTEGPATVHTYCTYQVLAYFPTLPCAVHCMINTSMDIIIGHVTFIWNGRKLPVACVRIVRVSVPAYQNKTLQHCLPNTLHHLASVYLVSIYVLTVTLLLPLICIRTPVFFLFLQTLTSAPVTTEGVGRPVQTTTAVSNVPAAMGSSWLPTVSAALVSTHTHTHTQTSNTNQYGIYGTLMTVALCVNCSQI